MNELAEKQKAKPELIDLGLQTRPSQYMTIKELLALGVIPSQGQSIKEALAEADRYNETNRP